MTRILMTLAAAVLALMPVMKAFAAAGPSGDPAALDGTAWILSALPGRDLVPGSQVTLQVAGGAVHGSDGCNRYTGAYTADAEGFRLSGNVASTMMACPEPLMQQAAAFIDALTRARAARIEGGRLVLSDAGGTVLATLAPQNRSLPGSAWRVTGYNNGREAVVSLLADTEMTMAFGADGGVSGSAGCNAYHGAFTVSETGLRIGPLAATRRMCERPAGLMEQEAAFLSALEQAATVRIDGDRLELRSADGALMVTADRAEHAAAPEAHGGTGKAAVPGGGQ